MPRSDSTEKPEHLTLAMTQSKGSCTVYKTVFHTKVGRDDSWSSIKDCSRLIVLDMNNTILCEEEASLNIFKSNLVISKQRLKLCLLSWKQSDLLFNLLNIIEGRILNAEAKLAESYIVKYNNGVLQMLILQLGSIDFMNKVDLAVDICIEREIARFFGSTESELEALREKIKATAITVTETATESSATLGIESAAQALGQAAIGVGITIIVDLALTSHSLYKAKKAKDMGLIDEKQFETKVKKKVCESGCQFIGGTTGSVVGQLVIPIPVVGAFVGGLCGSLIGTGIGKGVNYGLFERNESPDCDEKVVSEFKLIVSVLDKIKHRNPDIIITYIEKDNTFEEIRFNEKLKNTLAPDRERKPSFSIRYLLEKKPNKSKTLQQSTDSDVGNVKLGWKRRNSDSVGYLGRKKATSDRGKRLDRENSLSTSCLDRCCEELTADNDDNGVDPKVITKTDENKSAGQMQSRDDQESQVILKESLRTEDSCIRKNIMRTLKSFDAIIKGKEKSHSNQQKDNGKSQEQFEEMTTEDLTWSPSIGSISFNKREESATQESHDGAFPMETLSKNCDVKVDEAGKEERDPKNIFRVSTFGKIASIWKEKASLSESNLKDYQKGAYTDNEFVRRLFKMIHRREERGTSDEGGGETELDESKGEDSLREMSGEYPRNRKEAFGECEIVNDDVIGESTFFLTRHAAYGIKIRELVQNANNLNENDKTNETATVHVTHALSDDETNSKKDDRFQSTLKMTKQQDTSKDNNEEQRNAQKIDGNRISTLTKEFILKLKRNLTQRHQKREEYTENQENAYKTEIH